jgi:hypothetical protein
MKKLFTLFTLSLVFFSCQKNKDSLPAPASQENPYYIIPSGYTVPDCLTPTETAIMAGQNDNVGSIVVWNDETNVYVSYQTIGAYKLNKTHLFIGACSAIPVNGAGSPRIGLFPFTATHGTSGVSIYTYTIPRSSLPAGCVCIAAHAEIVAFNSTGQQYYSQTGWGNGDQINDGGSWAMRFSYCPEECPEEEVR